MCEHMNINQRGKVHLPKRFKMEGVGGEDLYLSINNIAYDFCKTSPLTVL